jgi:hypothetical protein
MPVPETADSFRTIIGSQRSLDEGEGISFYFVSLLEDRCMRLLKNFVKRMPQTEIRYLLADMHISVWAVMQLLSKRRD